MAETWTYGVYWGLGSNAQLPDSEPIPITIRRIDNTSKDGSFYKLASSTGNIRSNVNIKTWGTGGLKIGPYGNTDTLASNSSNHTFNVDFLNISSSILSVGSSSVSANLTRTSTSQTIYIYGTQSSPFLTFTISVTEKYSASTFSVGSVNFGSTSTVTLSNANISDLKHVVKWTIGSRSSSVETSTGASSASITIPSAWMDQVPNSTSTSGSVEVKTYRGSTQIGSATTGSFTVTVPASVKPTIGSITCTIKDPNAGIPNTYIQNTTGVYIQLNNVAAGTGATINASAANCPISAHVQETYAFDASNLRYTVNRLTNSGTITFSVSVKDSRGRQSNVVTATINVMAYTLPTITAASAYRCRRDGVADELGTYATIRVVVSYTASGGNTVTINSTYYNSATPSSQITAQNDMTSGESYIVGNGNLNPSNSYYIRFTVTDSLGNNVIKNEYVQSASYAIHVKNGGSGVAFGKTSEIANSVEINEGWELYYKGVAVLPVIFSTTTPSNPVAGLVWLQPKS